MQATIRTINSVGLNEIAEFLITRSKICRRTGTTFTERQIAAWAQEAEFQLAEGNPPMIELRSSDSFSGQAETFTVSDAGIDSQTIEIDE